MIRANGPDGIMPKLLGEVNTSIFNWSMETCLCFSKNQLLFLLQGKNISCLDDYRSVAFTSVAMKISS